MCSPPTRSSWRARTAAEEIRTERQTGQFLVDAYLGGGTTALGLSELATFLADESAVFQCYISEEPIAAAKQGVQVGYLQVDSR